MSTGLAFHFCATLGTYAAGVSRSVVLSARRTEAVSCMLKMPLSRPFMTGSTGAVRSHFSASRRAEGQPVPGQ